MSLFETLMRKASDELAGEVLNEERFDGLVDQLESELDGLDDSELKKAGEASLGELKKRRSDVLHLGKTGLVLFISHIAGGRSHEAELEFIRNAATPDDLSAGMIEDAGLVVQVKRSEEEFKAAAIDIIKTIGIKGAQVLLPLLLGVI